MKEEGNALFNDALNTFYLRLYGVGHMKNYSDSEKGRKEGNVLFNSALNTFYLWLYGIGCMEKDHSDSEKGNLLSPHSITDQQQGVFYMHHPTDSCYTSCGALV